MTAVTLDTNVFPAAPLLSRAQRVGIVAAAVTVSRRELEGSSLEEEVLALEAVLETAVWNESRWGQAVWGSSADVKRLDRVLAVLSNGSFPPRGQRSRLSDGQRRQLRDAMILCAHIRSNRDFLVSNDRRAFIADARREAIEAEFGAHVMTVEEFDAYLSEQKTQASV
jgi:hypothetical protein